MNLEALRESIGPHGRDVRLNLGTVLTPEGAPGLLANQIWGIALACAYATKSKRVIEAIRNEAAAHASAAELEAAKSAATVMAMNNVYYRFTHLAEDGEISRLPAKLRMNVIGNPGIPKVDFELYSLAVSALAGCAVCVRSHIAEAKKAGINPEGVQSTARIAAVIQSAAQAVTIDEMA